MTYTSLTEADLTGKRVLVRAGFDLPIENGKVTDTSRIEAVLPTIKHILKGGGSVVLLAHQGRPKGTGYEEEFSQKPLVEELEKLLDMSIQFAGDTVLSEEAQSKAKNLKPGEVLLLENLRFHKEEKANDPDFGKKLAELGDIYVNEAFTNCHRPHASMVGIPKHLPKYMGLQLAEEVKYLSMVFKDPKKPVALIVSGAKMETKVPVIESFLKIGDDILVGGCIANTFIAAMGFDMGKSRYEEEFIETAQTILGESSKEGTANVHVPRDVVVATEPSETAEKLDLPVEDIIGDMSVFDIGKVTIKRYEDIIEKAGTIIWNGPLGLYELNRFSHATKRIAEAMAAATKRGAVTLIGGGDTIDFHIRYQYPLDAYTFVSMGGGAMLEFISGKQLPALLALQN